MTQAKRDYGTKFGGTDLLNRHQRLSAHSLLGLASIAQVLLLWQLGHLTYSSTMLLALVLLGSLLATRKRLNSSEHKHYTERSTNKQSSSSSLFVLAVGGLGMLVGSTLDSIILSQELCTTSKQLPMGLVYQHFHGIEGLASYMVLIMMLFCLPSCIVYCSPVLEHKNELISELCKHTFASVCMLLGMLYIPYIVQSVLLALSEQLDSTANLNQLLSPLIVQHCLMLVSMLIGSLFGYHLFAYFQSYSNFSFKQI